MTRHIRDEPALRSMRIDHLLFALALQSCAIDDPELSTVEEPVYVHEEAWFEMERASTSGGMQIQTDPTGASNGKYLAVNGTGYGRHFLDVEESSQYYVWARVIAPSATADSIDVAIDSVTVRWQIPTATTWTWLPVMGTATTETTDGRARWSLTRGPHELRFTADELGVRIDRVLITQSRTFTPIAKTFQAEWGSVVAPMRIATQKLPYTTYASVPNGSGMGGRLDLDIDVPAGLSYRVWGRANAPSLADNKFFVGKPTNLGLGWAWEPPVTSSSGWTWSLLPSSLSSFDGDDRLVIHQGDDGTKLDKVLITNDVAFWLVEASPPPTSSL